MYCSMTSFSLRAIRPSARATTYANSIVTSSRARSRGSVNSAISLLQIAAVCDGRLNPDVEDDVFWSISADATGTPPAALTNGTPAERNGADCQSSIGGSGCSGGRAVWWSAPGTSLWLADAA